MLDILLCIAASQIAASQTPAVPQKPATPEKPAARHVQATPSQLSAVVTVNDLPQLLSNGRKNSWYQYFLDPQLAELRSWFDLQRHRHHDAADEEDNDSGRIPVRALVESIEALSVFLVPTPESPVGALGVILQAREAHQPLNDQVKRFHARLAQQDEPVVETWHDTRLNIYTAIDPTDDAGKPVTVVCAELEGLFFFTFGELGEAEPEFVIQLAKDSIDRSLDAEATNLLSNERFLEARGSSSSTALSGRGHHIEGFVDVPSLVNYIPKDRKIEPIIAAVVRSLSSIPWVYGSLTLGEGEELDSQFGFRCDPETLLGQIVGLARPAPNEMLKLLPPDSSKVSVGAFDMGALVDIVLGSVERFAPEGTVQKVEAVLALAKAQSGVDPVQDVLRAFTGEFAIFQRYPEIDDIDDDSSMVSFAMMETIVVGLADGDEFADNLDDVLSATGLDTYLEIDDYEDIDIYTSSLGMPISWAVTDGFLAVSGRREDIEHLIRASLADQPSVLDGERLSLPIDETEGTSMFTVYDTAAALKVMGEAFDMVSNVSMAAPQMDEMTEVLQAFGSDGIFASDLVDKYLDGLTYSSLTVEGGRVWLRSWGR